MDSIGLVTVDQDTLGTGTVKVEYTHVGVAVFSSTFTVTVACPTLTTSTITGSPLNLLAVATGIRTNILTGTTYVTNPSAIALCAVTYALKNSDGSPYVGTWL